MNDRLLLNDGEVSLGRPRVDVAAELHLRIGRLNRYLYNSETGWGDYLQVVPR